MYQLSIVTDLTTEPVTLQDAKSFMGIDYSDFDTLIESLIVASREAVENVTGKALGSKLIQIVGNSYTDNTGLIVKIYPITPFVSDQTWTDEDRNIDYQYNAGYSTCPEWAKLCIKQRVATGFAYRENGVAESINMAVNASIQMERRHVTQLAV